MYDLRLKDGKFDLEAIQASGEVPPEKVLAALYANAYHLYDAGHFDQAIGPFQLLVTLNPYEEQYWMGLGAALQMNKSYEKALNAYAMAVLLDDENPYPHFHAAECYISLKNLDDVVKALNLAEEAASGDHYDKDLQDRISALRIAWDLEPKKDAK